ncbi:MAG: hypothetical protein LBS19_10800 [Clostridiales bacterium]|jgi:hypothetical protein|nr:hypothetical protein [Clostridiales bacterium]
MGKVKTAVLAHFTLDEQVIPLRLETEDGARLKIDRVRDARPAASLKAGASGVRYICDCTAYNDGEEVPVDGLRLFRDDDGWFLE